MIRVLSELAQEVGQLGFHLRQEVLMALDEIDGLFEHDFHVVFGHRIGETLSSPVQEWKNKEELVSKQTHRKLEKTLTIARSFRLHGPL